MESNQVNLHVVLHCGGTVAVVKNEDGTFSVSQVNSPSLQVSAASLSGGEMLLTEEQQKGYIGAALFHIVQELVLKRLMLSKVDESVQFTQPGGEA